MSVDGAGRRKERIDAIAAIIRRRGEAGAYFNSVITWAEREQGILAPKAVEFVGILVKCGEVRHDRKTDMLYYVQKRGQDRILETP